MTCATQHALELDEVAVTVAADRVVSERRPRRMRTTSAGARDELMRIGLPQSLLVLTLAVGAVGRVDQWLVDSYRTWRGERLGGVPERRQRGSEEIGSDVGVPSDGLASSEQGPPADDADGASPHSAARSHFEESLAAKYHQWTRADVIDELGAPFPSSTRSPGARSEYYFCEATAWAEFMFIDDKVVTVDDSVGGSVARQRRSSRESPWMLQPIAFGFDCGTVTRLNGHPDYVRGDEWYYTGRMAGPGLRVVFNGDFVVSCDELPPAWIPPPRAEKPASD